LNSSTNSSGSNSLSSSSSSSNLDSDINDEEFHSILDALEQAKPTLDALNEEDYTKLAEYDAQIAEA
jgi:hypothetical protein